MRKILVIGGTGTMGSALVSALTSGDEWEPFAVCRNVSNPESRCHYIYCDIMKEASFKEVVENEKYDAIVDFMWYDPDTFAARIPKLLKAAKHYICLSSSAVYAHASEPFIEESPRFYDSASEEEKNDKGWHYHLEKARIENIIRTQENKNWTIIRPHVTMNSNHIPLTVWSEDVWLWRAAHNLPVVVYEDLLKPKSTYTMSSDVAKMIIAILNNGIESYGEIYNVVSDTVLTGEQLLNMYEEILQGQGILMKVVRKPDSSSYYAYSPMGAERITYDRAKDRVLCNNKIQSIANLEYADFKEDLTDCVKMWLAKNNNKGAANAAINEIVLMEKLTGVKTPLKYFKSSKAKKNYVISRYSIVGKVYNSLLQPIVGIIKKGR